MTTPILTHYTGPFRTMYDSVKLNEIPRNAEMAATYINGSWAVNSAVFERAFPHAERVLIDVDGTRPDADARDWESGDKSGSLEQWVQRHNTVKNRKDAVIYCNRATIPEVRNLTGSQILGKDYWLWVATLDGTVAQTFPSAPTGVIAVQAWGAPQFGLNADKSIVFAFWWQPGTPPTPVKPKMISGVIVQDNLASYDVSSSDAGKTWHSDRTPYPTPSWAAMLLFQSGGTLITRWVASRDSGSTWQ